jgi:predicted MFS family arabinose efflux permease
MAARLRYALLLVIAATPLLDVGAVKPAPLAVAIALFAVHGLLSLVTRSFERLAIGQVVVGIVAGGALGAGVAVFGSLRSHTRDRRHERLVLHLFGALPIAAVVVHRA